MRDKSKLLRAFGWIASFVCLMGFVGNPSRAAEKVNTTPPAVTDLQSGDFIWPKEPGAIIPYAAPGQNETSDRAIWESERNKYITTLMSRATLTKEEERRIDILKGMSFDTFQKVYAEDVSPEAVIPYGGLFGVGHVAIVRIVDGKPPTIVEAMWGKGVREISYEAWKAERKGQIFWHGRLKNIGPKLRAAIAEDAFREVGKPYKFWNFDLADESGFYCSKLAWLMIRNATSIVVDEKPDPVRLLWFSPKQLLKSSHFEMLQNPGSYGLQRKYR